MEDLAFEGQQNSLDIFVYTKINRESNFFSPLVSRHAFFPTRWVLLYSEVKVENIARVMVYICLRIFCFQTTVVKISEIPNGHAKALWTDCYNNN